MDDLAATYVKLINLDHVSSLNDIVTTHTTQRECVFLCLSVCMRGSEAPPGALGVSVRSAGN